MKILHVLPSLARGGGERLAIELANRQVAAGDKVTMVLGHPLPKDRAHDGLDRRVKVHLVSDKPMGRLGKYPEMVRWISANRSLIADHDVLHCHLTYGALFAAGARALAGRNGPAVVETYHAVGMPIPRIQRWFHAQLAGQWDGLGMMVEDPYWREFFKRNAHIASKVIPIGLGETDTSNVTRKQQADYRASLGIPADAKVVTTVSRLIEERRPRRYVPAFATIAEELGPNVYFVMGGDGPERAAIERDAAAAGIADRLHLPGLIERIELPLSISDLYVTANVGAVSGVAGLQAVAAKVPVIAIQLRGDHSGESDWIWSSRNPAEVGDKAVELLRSDQTRNELAKRQYRHLQAEHSAAAMARSYGALYREAIRRRSGG
ncbi:glycosyltransferase [Sphingomonas sp. SM33]|uniref:Glycosyltransferase n=1 Tax=Sphingomonas telluris TaxID=2907998 RepID=A0ABS9VLN2_9SPHN|nr:glycosyltransferase [Sphingomonas telluris]MCH8615870.1 glycosyltransferase [Sphingomonas telluris]